MNTSLYFNKSAKIERFEFGKLFEIDEEIPGILKFNLVEILMGKNEFLNYKTKLNSKYF